MRSFQLARLAAEAEAVRLRAFAERTIARIVLGVIALLFVLGAVAFGHVAAWYWLRTGLDWTFLAATGILGGMDLLAAIVLGLLAIRSAPSGVEREALAVRRQAIQAIGDTLSPMELMIRILRTVANLRHRKPD